MKDKLTEFEKKLMKIALKTKSNKKNSTFCSYCHQNVNWEKIDGKTQCMFCGRSK